MIYREWVLSNAVWTKAGNLTTRAATDPSYPQWLLQAPLWTQIWSGPVPGEKLWCVDPLTNIRLAKALGTPIGTHWYGWNNELFDTHYPVYTPKACFAATTAAMQSADPPVHVIPYVSICRSTVVLPAIVGTEQTAEAHVLPCVPACLRLRP
jgi:hypothetical protein